MLADKGYYKGNDGIIVLPPEKGYHRTHVLHSHFISHIGILKQFHSTAGIKKITGKGTKPYRLFLVDTNFIFYVCE